MTPAIVVSHSEDSAVLEVVHAACFEQGWSAETFGRLLASPGTFSLVAFEGDTKVGFALIRVAADEAEILSIGVIPSARRRGIAARVLVQGAKCAARAGARKLFLEAGVRNPSALSLYRKFGFREVGHRPGYYGAESGDGVTMRADLSPNGLGIGPELD
jgi:ribosomal-protein-alanine N-acetyltransferase